jgi:hypothetical protein
VPTVRQSTADFREETARSHRLFTAALESQRSARTVALLAPATESNHA